MSDAGQMVQAVNQSQAVELSLIMSHQGNEAQRDIGRLYLTLHKISKINQLRGV
jgi:hypothetical protein